VWSPVAPVRRRRKLAVAGGLFGTGGFCFVIIFILNAKSNLDGYRYGGFRHVPKPLN